MNLSKEEILEEIKKEKEVEQNKRDAIQLATRLFNVIRNPELVANSTPDQRHKLCIEKARSLAEAFPLVVVKLSRDLDYNEKAFRKFLDRLHQDPGKGMEGVMERQADYAKFLYIENCRAKNVHLNMKRAQEIWNHEYKHMKKWVKKTKEQEKSAKSEFEEEQKKHLDERKQELFDFLQEAKHHQQTEDPDAFMQSQIDLTKLNVDDLSMSDSDEMPSALQNQKKDTVITQEKQAPLTEEEIERDRKYREQYEQRLIKEREMEELMENNRKEKLRQDMLLDSNVGNWKSRKSQKTNKSKNQSKKKRKR